MSCMRFVGGPIILPHGTENVSISVADGIISAIGADGRVGEREINLGGRTLAPGFIDLHGDAIEKELEPRPGAFFPVDAALHAIDRRCATSGITTAYHAISFATAEFGVRNADRAADLVRAVARFNKRSLIEHRAHVRYEVTDEAAESIVAQLIRDGEVHLLSLMDHTPGQGQFKDVSAYEGYLRKAYGTSEKAIDAILKTKLAAAKTVLTRIERLAALARAADIPIASHDDDHPERVQQMAQLGVRISEFPLDLETAKSARKEGLATVVGAPNVLRGASLSGGLNGRDAVQEGAASCIASDYAPQAIPPALGVLIRQGLSESRAHALASANPADAARLSDRGRIAEGQRADLIALEGDGEHRRVMNMWHSRGKALHTDDPRPHL